MLGFIYKAGDVLAHLTASSSKARQELSGRAFFLVILLWLAVCGICWELGCIGCDAIRDIELGKTRVERTSGNNPNWAGGPP